MKGISPPAAKLLLYKKKFGESLSRCWSFCRKVLIPTEPLPKWQQGAVVWCNETESTHRYLKVVMDIHRNIRKLCQALMQRQDQRLNLSEYRFVPYTLMYLLHGAEFFLRS